MRSLLRVMFADGQDFDSHGSLPCIIPLSGAAALQHDFIIQGKIDDKADLARKLNNDS
jgi:hypothetical protein